MEMERMKVKWLERENERESEKERETVRRQSEVRRKSGPLDELVGC